jgi:ketosteroid isomerase-like protein
MLGLSSCSLLCCAIILLSSVGGWATGTWAQMLALPGPDLTFQTIAVDVARSADLAYETGTYDFAISNNKNKVKDEKGKYVVVWKKQDDGSWKGGGYR